MMFLQGDKDFQVSAERDFKVWKEILAGKANVVF